MAAVKNPIVRNIGAVILGLFVGSLANMGVIMLSTKIWPMPEGLDMYDTQQMAAYVATLPAAAWGFAMAAHLSQAFVGGWVAARLGASHPMRLALIVAVLTLLGGVMNAINLSPPAWMWIEMPLYLVVGAAAGHLEVKRRASQAA